MTLPRLTKRRGGFRRGVPSPIKNQDGSVNLVSLSVFIRDQLTQFGVSWGFNIYTEYKLAAQAIPKARGGGKRHVINYSGFSHYLYVLRKLGFIEYVLNPDGSIQESPAHQKGSQGDIDLPDLPPARMIRLTGKGTEREWQNIWLAYRGGVPVTPTPTPFVMAPQAIPVVITEELDIDAIKSSLTDLMDEGNKTKSIKALGKALDGLDESKIGGIDGVREAIDEYREIGRAGITPEEYQEAKQRAFEFIQQTIDDLELTEEE